MKEKIKAILFAILSLIESPLIFLILLFLFLYLLGQELFFAISDALERFRKQKKANKRGSI